MSFEELAGEMDKLLEKGDKKSKKKGKDDEPLKVPSPEGTAANQEDPSGKKGLFSKLFGKKKEEPIPAAVGKGKKAEPAIPPPPEYEIDPPKKQKKQKEEKEQTVSKKEKQILKKEEALTKKERLLNEMASVLESKKKMMESDEKDLNNRRKELEAMQRDIESKGKSVPVTKETKQAEKAVSKKARLLAKL